MYWHGETDGVRARVVCARPWLGLPRRTYVVTWPLGSVGIVFEPKNKGGPFAPGGAVASVTRVNHISVRGRPSPPTPHSHFDESTPTAPR
jgi:hypothetical protein